MDYEYDDIIEAVKLVLEQNVESTESSVKTALRACLRLTAPILEARVDIGYRLMRERNRLRMPKDKEFTDFDRQVMLDDAVSDLRAEHELLSGLEEQLKIHVSALQSLI